MEFEINEARTVIINENPVYVLPENTMIYFGSKSKYFDHNEITFFSFEKEVAKKYGHIIHKFVTNRELKLLSFMDLEKNHKIYKDADDNMKKILDSTFSIGINGNKIRLSSGNSDRKIMKYLCDTKENHGCDGYAMNGNYLADAIGGNFHAEMVLCPPINDVVEFNNFEIGEQEAPRLEKKGRKRRPEPELYNMGVFNMGYSYGSHPSSPVKLNQSNSHFSTPPTTPVRGGKKKITRKNKKSRKVKRKTKRNKKSKKSKKNKKHLV